jgi:5-methyltetrahydropteroyltriglutamate--homocysteine methyltransferase
MIGFIEIVMAGLVPAIHVMAPRTGRKTWMPGTSPGTTNTYVRRPRDMADRRQIKNPEDASHMLFPTTIAGSLPKPEWLAEPNVLWAPWKSTGAELARAKRDATMLAVKLQEDAGVDIVTEGEQARQHFVHGFLANIEGIDFAHKVEMGIRKDRYKAMVPQVVAPLKLKGRVHADEARIARTHTSRQLKFTLPGPMTIIDTIADQYYGDRVKMAFAFAELLNEEAKALQADGVDVIQFDEPAFNVYMDEVGDWGIKALERAAEGLTCATAVHICYGYGIKANTDWKETLGSEWRQYEDIFPAIDASSIQQVAIECRNSRVPLELLGLLKGKVVQAGVIDVASDVVETAEDVVSTIEAVMKHVPASNIVATTNCGMAPMHRDIAEAKLMALGAGARLARQRFG